MEYAINMDDLGVPVFMETSIYFQIVLKIMFRLDFGEHLRYPYLEVQTMAFESLDPGQKCEFHPQKQGVFPAVFMAVFMGFKAT